MAVPKRTPQTPSVALKRQSDEASAQCNGLGGFEWFNPGDLHAYREMTTCGGIGGLNLYIFRQGPAGRARARAGGGGARMESRFDGPLSAIEPRKSPRKLGQLVRFQTSPRVGSRYSGWFGPAELPC